MDGGLFSCIEKSGFRNFLEDGLSYRPEFLGIQETITFELLRIKISNLIFVLEIENTLSLTKLFFDFYMNFLQTFPET
jgi:hypothetical protein